MRPLLLVLAVVAGVIVVLAGVALLGDDGNDDLDGPGMDGDMEEEEGSTVIDHPDGPQENASAQWEVVFSEGRTMFDQDSGADRDELTFNVPSTGQGKLMLKVTATTCGCGGQGDGQLTVLLSDPNGAQQVQETYTESAESTFTFNNPASGSWTITFIGAAWGTDFILGYQAEFSVQG